MATVRFEGATRQFDPHGRPAVDHVDLDVADGEFLVLVGPSGCGKSTTLRMLAGLEPVDEGRVLIDGADMTGVRARDRDVAMVFQSYALYPNMTARQNMAFALENAKVPKAQIAQRVEEAAGILQLGDLLDRKPGKMSGGQRQRVAMGRAIVRHPKVFCMDEPLSNLDAKLRVSTRSEIAALQRRLGVTTLYVTHDQTEAMTMGDRVAVLDAGHLHQVAPPDELYARPVNTFVAAFIGSPSITLLDQVPVTDAVVALGDGPDGRTPVPAGYAKPTVTLGVRPESWRLEAGPGSLRLRATLVESLGSEYIVHAAPVDADAPTVRAGRLTIRVDKRHRVAIDDVFDAAPRADELYFFDADTGDNVALS